MFEFLDAWVNYEILVVVGVSILFVLLVISMVAKTAWNTWRHKQSCKIFDDMGKEKDED